MLACEYENTDEKVIKYLIQAGANPNARDNYNSSALYLTHNFKVMQCLLENGTDPNLQNMDGETILHRLCVERKPDFKKIQLLVEHGLDLNIQNNSGYIGLERLFSTYIINNEQLPIDQLQYFIDHGLKFSNFTIVLQDSLFHNCLRQNKFSLLLTLITHIDWTNEELISMIDSPRTKKQLSPETELVLNLLKCIRHSDQKDEIINFIKQLNSLPQVNQNTFFKSVSNVNAKDGIALTIIKNVLEKFGTLGAKQGNSKFRY